MYRSIRRAAARAALLVVLTPWPSSAQAPLSEMEQLRQEVRQLRERLQRLEQQPQPAAVAPAPVPVPAVSQVPPPAPSPALIQSPTLTQAAPVAPRPGEREVILEREHPFEVLGLSKPELAGVRIAGFFVGSANYNTKIQMVPEFAGSAPVSSEPRSVDFRFDQFTIGAYKTFAPWLSAGASLEVERHSHRHTHGFDPDFGCPGVNTLCIEQFGSESPETEINLHRFYITGIVPVGNGLAVSFGRFDTPYGYERHDAPLNLTATTSELQRYGRPQSMTGFQFAYQFAPWLDAMAWVVNRWENETTEDSFEDNNRDKSFGGRVGFTPIRGNQLLNLGIGGWWGPEQDDDTKHDRWIVDADLTWSINRLVLAAEFLYGGESGVSFRRRGAPFSQPEVVNEDVNWMAFYALAHYDIAKWLGLSFRYGFFKDYQGARTGVQQVLQSFTIAPVFHLSRLVPDLRPLGVTYSRTRHPLDWVDVRLEYRFNHSNRPVFSDAKPGVPITEASHNSQQVTLQFVVNY